MARKKSSRKKTKRRASWRGVLRFGLVTIPVQAFNAASRDSGSVHFHQLHATCHRRIHYEKVCPEHGPVDASEIISGYEYKKGKYVEVDSDELDDLKPDKQRSLRVDAFIDPEELDAIYFDGRMYYLAPEGADAAESYAVLQTALEVQHRVGIGEIFFSGKDQLVMVRPYQKLLQMAMLNYSAEIWDPADLAEDLPRVTRNDKRLRLAEQLIQGVSDEDFEYADYEDHYRERVQELVDAKVEGREVVEPKEEEPAEVINLMDALKKSLAQASGEEDTRSSSKPRRSGRKGAAKKRRAS